MYKEQNKKYIFTFPFKNKYYPLHVNEEIPKRTEPLIFHKVYH